MFTPFPLAAELQVTASPWTHGVMIAAGLILILDMDTLLAGRTLFFDLDAELRRAKKVGVTRLSGE